MADFAIVESRRSAAMPPHRRPSPLSGRAIPVVKCCPRGVGTDALGLTAEVVWTKASRRAQPADAFRQYFGLAQAITSVCCVLRRRDHRTYNSRPGCELRGN